MGEVEVDDARYWGAQTQRSLMNFPIGGQRMPIEIVRAFAVLKKAAARTNAALAGFSAASALASAAARRAPSSASLAARALAAASDASSIRRCAASTWSAVDSSCSGPSGRSCADCDCCCRSSVASAGVIVSARAG